MTAPARPVEASTGYAPRPLQARLHKSLRRFNVLVAHRRFGKTVFCINELIHAAWTCGREAPRVAYVAPLFNQAKDVAWEYLKRYTAPVVAEKGGARLTNETELRVDLTNGGRVRLYGADNPDRLRGIYLDGVVLDEYAQMHPRVWPEVIRPALADREGFAVFIGTPMGRNAFCELYEAARDGRAGLDWFAAMHKASETGIIRPAELEAARATMSEDQYAQEFECSFEAAIIGSYYARLLAAAEADRRIANVPWEPKVPVHTAWDLGTRHATAIWFCQQVAHEVRLIDYYEASGVGLDHYAKLLREKPYVYGEHILPHDAEMKELGTGTTRVETLTGLGIRPRVLPAGKVDDGINAARLLLPRCWFDKVKCARGLEALRQYRREYNDKRKAFKSHPLDDWAADPADAFRYLAVGLRPDAPKLKPVEYPKQQTRAIV